MAKIDLLPYFKCDDRQMYELQYNIAGHSGTQTIQTQVDGKLFYHVKGHEWERLYFDDHFIYREADTSEAPDRYYVQTKNGIPGADWVKRHMSAGEEYHADPFVKHYWQETGHLRAEAQCANTLKLIAVHDSYRFKSGITLLDVAELAWIINGQPEEYYYYAKGFGLVAWKQARHGWESYICEELRDRPDLEREVIKWIPEDPPVLYYKPAPDVTRGLMRVTAEALSVRIGPGTTHDDIWVLKENAVIYVNSLKEIASDEVWAEWGSGLWSAAAYDGNVYLKWIDGDPVLAPEPFKLLKPDGYVTQVFGARPWVYAKWKLPGHEGIDFGMPLGSPVEACADGTVYRVHLKDDNAYGIHVRIIHVLPDGRRFKTIYAHLMSASVQVGDVVKAGDIIGLIGLTGNTTGPHLHLTLKLEGATAGGETIFPGDQIDPAPFLGLE